MRYCHVCAPRDGTHCQRGAIPGDDRAVSDPRPLSPRFVGRIPTNWRSRKMRLFVLVALFTAAVLVPSALATASAPRSGDLHATKNCLGFTGDPGSYCLITSSNLPQIEVGSRIDYLQPPLLLPPLGATSSSTLPGRGTTWPSGTAHSQWDSAPSGAARESSHTSTPASFIYIFFRRFVPGMARLGLGRDIQHSAPTASPDFIPLLDGVGIAGSGVPDSGRERSLSVHQYFFYFYILILIIF